MSPIRRTRIRRLFQPGPRVRKVRCWLSWHRWIRVGEYGHTQCAWCRTSWGER